MNEDSLKSRAVGLLLLCVGVVLAYWNYSTRSNGDGYYPKIALLAPVLIALAVYFIVEAPTLPAAKLSVFGWICLIGGIGVGIWSAFF